MSLPTKNSFEAEITAHSQQIVSKILNNIRPESEKMVKDAFHFEVVQNLNMTFNKVDFILLPQ